MKKIGMIFVLVMLLGSVVNAEAPSGETVDATYIWELDTTISSAVEFDTISGDDSIIVAAKFSPEPGYQYILVTDALTEGVEAEFILNIACQDASGNVLYVSSAVDTLDDDGDAVLLPFGETLFGQSFKLVLVDGAADDGTNILNRVYIYRRRTITGTQARWR